MYGEGELGCGCWSLASLVCIIRCIAAIVGLHSLLSAGHARLVHILHTAPADVFY